MSRQKAYSEEQVIEKATDFFWCNGYENTSMRALEEVMGINKFSIYASFGSKQGVFIESLKCYKNKLQVIVNTLRDSDKGVEAIKAFFYEFLEFSKLEMSHKGCLLTSTAGESTARADEDIMAEIKSFSTSFYSTLIHQLRTDKSKDEALVIKQANYLLVAKQGLSNASKVFDTKTLSDYIETTFENL